MKQSTIIRVNGTMALENMSLTEEDKQRIRNCQDGKSTVESEIEKIKQKYTDPK